MLELLTGTGLALSAGLNAYVPLLIMGIASRFLPFVELPPNWTWLENPWVLAILGVLLVIEAAADKIPAVDSINDWVQTLVRPTAGGLAFGSGTSMETAAVTDPTQFFESNWVPFVTGAAIALVVHLTKAIARPAANALTMGAVAPVLSTVEDASSVGLAIAAIVVPILILVAVPLLIWWGVRSVRKARASAAARKHEKSS